MNLNQLKEAFGSTPESVKECVRRSLREEQRRESVMKRKTKMSLAIAMAVIMMLGCAGFAASQLDGIAGIFGYTDPNTGEVVINEAAIAEITALNEVYEGKTVRFTLTEGLYTPLTKHAAMSWTLETIDPEAEYYILCNAQIGGSWIEAGSLSNMSEYFLKGKELSSRSGKATGDGLITELKFSIMKVNGEIIRYSYVEDDEDSSDERKQTRKEYLEGCISEGKLPMAGDGLIEVPGIRDATYAEELVATGLVELAEAFTVTFDLGAVSPGEAHRVYEGEKVFTFDGFEVRFNEVIVTPTGSRIEYDYISDTEITQEDYFQIASPKMHVEGVEVWTKSAGAVDSEPVQTEDGRWQVAVTYETYAQTVYPGELIFTLTGYDENNNPIPLTGEGIRLKLTDK